MRRRRLILALSAAMAIVIPAVPAEAASSRQKEAAASGTSADISTTMSQPGMHQFIYGGWYYIVLAGGTSFYTTVTNNSHTTAAASVQLTDSWSGGMLGTFLSYGVTTSAGAPTPSCKTPAVGVNGPVTCTVSSLGPGQSFTLRVTIRTRALDGMWDFTNSATATSTTPDPTTADNTAQASVLVKS